MMVILSRGSGRSRVGVEQGTTSIREVCLLGPPARQGDVGPGDALSWAGRIYHVVATDRGDALHVRPAGFEPR
ncbi:MAG: hypothetical protein JWN86_1885 [Planctomycetota bacterium]|nr:hypothetical protein [Planctomycetota bacterium]